MYPTPVMHRLRRFWAAVAVVLAMVFFTLARAALPGHAITGGSPDGAAHPNVAVIEYYDSEGRWECSATLVSPTVLLTAAHCTTGTIGKTIVSFASTVPASALAADDSGDGASSEGYTAAPTGWRLGTAHADPAFTGSFDAKSLHDVGVVVLDSPYTGAAPAQIAGAGYLDELAQGNGGLSKQTFTLVGYGVDYTKPSSGPEKPTGVGGDVRRMTTAVGQNISGDVLKLAENTNDARAGGGTCYGDSGGPALHNGVVVGITSFGASQFCRSSGGYYRLDTAEARSFLAQYIALT